MEHVSPAEFLILNTVYELGEADIKTVCDCFQKRKDWRYTTVLTLFQRLFDKGFLKRKKVGRKHVYRAAYSQVNLYKRTLKYWFGRNPNKAEVECMALALGLKK
jgi:BlaI family transcriptional regulator, penicillinase repressor